MLLVISVVLLALAIFVLAEAVSEIKKRTRRFINEAGVNGRFVLFLNDIPYDTPPDHIHTVVSAARDHQYALKV